MLKLKNPIYIIFSLMGHRLIQFHISACSQCGKGKSETNLHRFACWDNTKVSTDPVKQDCFLGIHDWSNANTIINLKQISFTDNKTKGLRQQTIWQTLWRGHCLNISETSTCAVMVKNTAVSTRFPQQLKSMIFGSIYILGIFCNLRVCIHVTKAKLHSSAFPLFASQVK